MDKILVFGTGADAERILRKRKMYQDFYQDEITGFVDNDSDKWGKTIHGYPIGSPKCLKDTSIDRIVISSRKFEQEIYTQLTEQLSIPEEKIETFDRYLSHMCICWNSNKYASVSDCNTGKLDTSATVVYTAIEGRYDNLKDPLFVGDNIHYVCFTDNCDIKSDIWDVKYVDSPEDGNTALDIRKYKALPQNYFPDSSLTIWVDGNLQILDNLNDFVRSYSRGSGFLCFPHPNRRCISTECGAIIMAEKENPVRVIRQTVKYLNDGYPENNGLLAGGLLIRNPKDEKLNRCMADWWREIQTGSLRDQISLPYVLWKNHYAVDVCDLNVNRNSYVQWMPHLV